VDVVTTHDARTAGVALAVSIAALVLPGSTAVAAAGRSTAPVGTNYAGFVKGGWPIAIQVSKDGREIVQAAIGVDMTCRSGSFGYDDGYFKVAITRSGAFKASFANQLVDNGQGRFSLWSGEVKGTFNRARTRVSGTWHVHDTERDAMGNATDQCDSGVVKFTAEQ
jgi:hypothetical protein